MFFIKSFFVLFRWLSQTLPPGLTLGTLFILGKLNHPLAQTLPSHSILLGHGILAKNFHMRWALLIDKLEHNRTHGE